MRQRIKSIKTENGIKPVENKVVKELFFLGKVAAVRVTTSGTRNEIQSKFRKRMAINRSRASQHYQELANMVKQGEIKTKYFVA